MATTPTLLTCGQAVPVAEGSPAEAAGLPSYLPRTAILLPSGCQFSASRPNSMETVVRTLAVATGHADTRIFCCEGADDHEMPGVEVLPSGPRRRQVLLQKLHAFRPQVIEHHQQVRQAVAVRAAIPEAAHLLYRHNPLKAPRTRLDAWRYHRRYARMDGFVFVSAAEKALFSREFPEFAGSSWAVPNPIDAVPWLAPLEGREPVIAFAGRAMAQKGLDIVCATLPAILDAHAGWRAVLMLNDWDQHKAWAGSHLAALERYGDRVMVLRSAPLSDVQFHMRTASIALTPSIWDEPFGLTATEAHAAGAALISSGRGGLREASGPHALYLDAVTTRTLGDAIDHLILNPRLRFAMAEAARHHVLEVHAPHKRAKDLARIRQFVSARRHWRS